MLDDLAFYSTMNTSTTPPLAYFLNAHEYMQIKGFIDFGWRVFVDESFADAARVSIQNLPVEIADKTLLNADVHLINCEHWTAPEVMATKVREHKPRFIKYNGSVGLIHGDHANHELLSKTVREVQNLEYQSIVSAWRLSEDKKRSILQTAGKVKSTEGIPNAGCNIFGVLPDDGKHLLDLLELLAFEERQVEAMNVTIAEQEKSVMKARDEYNEMQKLYEKSEKKIEMLKSLIDLYEDAIVDLQPSGTFQLK